MLIFVGLLALFSPEAGEAVISSATPSQFEPCTTPLPLGVEKVYVLHLERRADRLPSLRSTLRCLEDAGAANTSRSSLVKGSEDQGRIPVSIGFAVDGRQLNIEKDLEVFQPFSGYEKLRWDAHSDGMPYTVGEIACCLAHFAALKQMIADGVETAMIMEDDMCDPNLGESRIDEFIDSGKHFYSMDGKRTGAYLISRKGAQRFVAVESLLWPNWVALDDFICALGEWHKKPYCADAPPRMKKTLTIIRRHFQQLSGYKSLLTLPSQSLWTNCDFDGSDTHGSRTSEHPDGESPESPRTTSPSGVSVAHNVANAADDKQVEL